MKHRTHSIWSWIILNHSCECEGKKIFRVGCTDGLTVEWPVKRDVLTFVWHHPTRYDGNPIVNPSGAEPGMLCAGRIRPKPWLLNDDFIYHKVERSQGSRAYLAGPFNNTESWLPAWPDICMVLIGYDKRTLVFQREGHLFQLSAPLQHLVIRKFKCICFMFP